MNEVSDFIWLDFLAFELAIVQLGIEPILCQQFCMLALFDDISIFHHQDPICVTDGGKSMGDDEAGASLHQVVHGFLDQDFGVRIHRTCGFIQDEYFWICKESPGDRHQLHLTLRNICGLFIEHHVVAFRKGADKMVHTGSLGGANHIFIGSVGPSIADILHDGAIVQPGILQNHAKHAAQVRPGEILDVMPIHQNGPAVDVIEAHQQLNHGGLAGTGGADDGDLLAGFGIEGKVIDDDLIGVVTEVNILEIHTTFDLAQLNRCSGIGNFFRFSQELEDTLSSSHGLLENIGDIGDLGDRLGKGADILDKSLDITDGNGIH